MDYYVIVYESALVGVRNSVN